MTTLYAVISRSRSHSDCDRIAEHREKPDIDPESARKLAEKLYDITVESITELDGYDDRNYCIKALKNGQPPSELELYTLKITNSVDSTCGDLIESLNSIISFVHKADLIEVPYPIPNVHGQTVSMEHFNQGQTNAVRLLHFIPGKLLRDFVYTDKLAFQAGQIAAKLTNLLKNFHNLTLESRKSIWFFDFIFELEKNLQVLDDPSRQSLVKCVLDEFKACLAPHRDELKEQIIHGDLNEQNIIVRDIDGEPKIVGIIDFGDVNKAPRIFELAMLCCYMTLNTTLIEPTVIPKYVINGYQSVRTISSLEMKVLPICVMARLAQSLVLGVYSYLKDPHNDYVLSSSINGWNVLEKMSQIGSRNLEKLWTKKEKA